MTTKNKKEGKAGEEKQPSALNGGTVSSAADLKTYLQSMRDKMTDESAAPVYVMTAMNNVLNLPQIYDFLDNDNKEIARDIWLRLKQAGLQLRNPPLLFGPDEDTSAQRPAQS
jgi:hypothetical protein